MQGAGHQELPRIADDAGLRQLVRHGLGAGSLRKIEDHRFAKALVGGLQRHVSHGRGDDGQQDESEQQTLHDWRESR